MDHLNNTLYKDMYSWNVDISLINQETMQSHLHKEVHSETTPEMRTSPLIRTL